jgi:hypothetical protein
MDPTVSGDLELLARAVESNDRMCENPKHRAEWAATFRNRDAATLVDALDLVLWCDDTPMPARLAAKRLVALIADLDDEQLARFLVEAA